MASKKRNPRHLQANLEAARIPQSLGRHLTAPIREVRSQLADDLQKFFKTNSLDDRMTRDMARKVEASFRGTGRAIDEASKDLKRVLRAGGERIRKLSEQHQRDMTKAAMPVGSPEAARLFRAKIPLIHKMRFTGYGNKFAKDARLNLVRELKLGARRKETIEQTLHRLAGSKLRGKVVRAKTIEAKVKVAAEAFAAKAQRRAELIVRNELFATYNAVNKRLLMATGMRQQWVAAIDYRICPTCRGLDGLIRDADERFPLGEPPIHVNCRCIIVPAPPTREV